MHHKLIFLDHKSRIYGAIFLHVNSLPNLVWPLGNVKRLRKRRAVDCDIGISRRCLRLS